MGDEYHKGPSSKSSSLLVMWNEHFFKVENFRFPAFVPIKLNIFVFETKSGLKQNIFYQYSKILVQNLSFSSVSKFPEQIKLFCFVSEFLGQNKSYLVFIKKKLNQIEMFCFHI